MFLFRSNPYRLIMIWVKPSNGEMNKDPLIMSYLDILVYSGQIFVFSNVVWLIRPLWSIMFRGRYKPSCFSYFLNFPQNLSYCWYFFNFFSINKNFGLIFVWILIRIQKYFATFGDRNSKSRCRFYRKGLNKKRVACIS